MRYIIFIPSSTVEYQTNYQTVNTQGDSEVSDIQDIRARKSWDFRTEFNILFKCFLR